MKHKRFFTSATYVLAITALAMVFSCSSSQEEASPPPAVVANPNIILIVADALRQDVLGCYGGEANTPNLDSLAAGGVLFKNAYATSPWTPPSAISIFTGSYATSYPYEEVGKTVRAFVPDDDLMLAEVLRDRGYDTALRGGNYLIGLHNCLQGFELLPDELWMRTEDKTEIDRITGSVIRDNFGYLNTYSILNRLLNMPAGKPFFLAQWIIDPHEPLEPVNKFASRIRFDTSTLSHPANLFSRRNNIDGELTEADTRYLKARYIAEVESVDERVGYIVRMLRHLALLDSTYFVFTSDHGELFGEHGRFGHGVNYYEELVRVPLIVAGPGLPRGHRVDAPVSLVDLMSTLKDLLGLEYEEQMLGVSFKSVIFDDAAPARPVFFDDIREHGRQDALRDGDFKLVAMRDGTHVLFDLSSDPTESVDIAADRPDLAREMMQRILTIRQVNQQRQTANFARVDSLASELSDEEAEELDKKLRALGYIR